MNTVAVAMTAMLASQPTYDQQANPRVFFEAGKYQEAVETLSAQEDATPENRYLGALCYVKLDRPDDAKAQLAPLAAEPSEENPWYFIASSATALIDGDTGGAVERARQAVTLAPSLFHAQYQLGQATSAAGQQQDAAAAFDRAAQIDPGFAYAHYYAGLAYSKIKRLDQTAIHFEMFLRLAPAAPERAAVQSVLRTIGGR